MNLGKALEALKFDSRMRDWNINQGLLTLDEWKTHLQKLEDLSGKCAKMDLEGERRSSSNSLQ